MQASYKYATVYLFVKGHEKICYNQSPVNIFMNILNTKAWLLFCLCIAGVLSLPARVKTGSVCINAVGISTSESINQPDVEGWIRFTAFSEAANLLIERNDLADPVAIQGMTVYCGTPSALKEIGSDRLSDKDDLQLFVSLEKLKVGETYYVKTTKYNFNTNCATCSSDSPEATLSVLDIVCDLKVTILQEVDWGATQGTTPIMGIYTSNIHSPTMQLPPLCGNSVLQLQSNIAGSFSQVWLSNGVSTYSLAVTNNTFSVPTNTTSAIQSFTIVATPNSYLNFNIDNGCKIIYFDLLPVPDVNFGMQPNPVCQGNLFCLVSPPPSNLANVVYDYYKITGPWATPSFSAVATQWYGTPGSPSSIAAFITASAVATSTCLPTNSYSLGVHPFGVVSYYTFSNWPGYHGCVNTSVKNLTVSPNPGTVSISSSSTVVCKNAALTLTANIGPAIASVLWLPTGQTGLVASVSPSVSTTYTLIAYTAAGCAVTNTLFIEAKDCCNPELPSQIEFNNCSLVNAGTQGAIVWSSLTSGSAYTGANIALPAGGTISGNFFIKGNLTVNANVTIQNSRLVFDEAASVVQNAPVTIDKSYLNGCSKNWVGIRTGALLTIRNSVLEDAQDAVNSNVGTGIHPGIVLYNTIFNKNYRAVNIGLRSFALFSVKECVFTTRAIPPTLYAYQSGNLWRNMPAFTPSALVSYANANLVGSVVLGISNGGRGQVGIQLLAASSSQVGSSTINIGANLNQPYVNLFDNLPVGIFNYGSTIAVLKNQFMNHSGINGYDAFAAFSSGVYVENGAALIGTITGTVGSVSSNTFVANRNGVMATNNGSVQIGGNQFNGHTQSGVFITKMYGSSANNFVNQVVNNSFLNNAVDVNGYDNQKIQLQVMSNSSQHTPLALKNNQSYNVVLAELNQNAACQYSVESNVFNGKFTNGVLGLQLYGASVSNNTITMKPPTAFNYMSPISLENSAEVKVKSNVLDCTPSSSQSWNTFGIYTSNCVNNVYCSNDIKGNGTCLKFQGNSPSMIWKNKLNNNPSDPNLIGIFLDAGGSVGDIRFQVAGVSMCAENEFGDFTFADTYVGSGNAGFIYYPLPNSATNPYCPFVNLSSGPSVSTFTSVVNANVGYADCGGPTGEAADAEDEYSAAGRPPSEDFRFGQSAQVAVQVFPNPANSEFTVTTTLEDAEFTLYNVLGERALAVNLRQDNVVDISHLKAGSYFYTVHHRGQLIKSEKLVIAR